MSDTLPCPPSAPHTPRWSSPVEIDDRSAVADIHGRDTWTGEENVALALREQESR